MTVLTDTFLGPPFEAQFNISFQVNNNQHIQQTGSMPYLQLERIRSEKVICPPIDKDNMDYACNLLILEIIETFRWDPTVEQLATSGKEYLSQACAEDEHHSLYFSSSAGTNFILSDTKWDDNIRRMVKASSFDIDDSDIQFSVH
jgi:hypothetical protein